MTTGRKSVTLALFLCLASSLCLAQSVGGDLGLLSDVELRMVKEYESIRRNLALTFAQQLAQIQAGSSCNPTVEAQFSRNAIGIQASIRNGRQYLSEGSLHPEPIRLSLKNLSDTLARSTLRFAGALQKSNCYYVAEKHFSSVIAFFTGPEFSEFRRMATAGLRSVRSQKAAELRPNAATNTALKPTYKLDDTQSKVIELSNLSPGGECHPDRATGRVAKRVFDEKLGTLMRGFTIEESSGERSYINVEPLPEGLDMVTLGWVARGLQTLLKEGEMVSVGIKLCGAAGRVIMADTISSSLDSKPPSSSPSSLEPASSVPSVTLQPEGPEEKPAVPKEADYNEAARRASGGNLQKEQDMKAALCAFYQNCR